MWNRRHSPHALYQTVRRISGFRIRLGSSRPLLHHRAWIRYLGRKHRSPETVVQNGEVPELGLEASQSWPLEWKWERFREGEGDGAGEHGGGEGGD
jgi:hypothetical protein